MAFRATPWLAVLVSLIVAGVAPAQEKRGFYFDWPVEVELSFESGLPVSVSSSEELAIRTVDDTVVIFRPPAPTLRLASRRAEFVSTYQPDFEIFLNNTDLGELNHAAGARFDFRATERLELNVGDIFRLTNDPSRDLGPNTFLLVRGEFRQNTLFAGLRYRLTQLTDVAFRFDDIRTSLDVGPFSVLPRQEDRVYSGSVSHRFGRRDTVAVMYSLLDASAPQDRLLPPGEPVPPDTAGFRLRSHNVSFGYRRLLSRALSFEGSGGFIHGARSIHYSASGRLELRLGTMRLITGYDRGLSHAAQERFPGAADPTFTSEIAPDSLLESVRIRFDGRLTPRLRMDAQAWAARRTPSLVSGSGELREGDTFWGRFRMDYWIAERVSAFAGVEAQVQDETIFAGVPIDRRRLMFGIRFGLTARDAEREFLLDGGRDISP